MKKKLESVNMLDLYQTYLEKKKKKEIKLGDFLWWLFREAKHT